MSIFPRSLLGRNALLIVLLIALGQLGCLLLVRQMIVRSQLNQIAEAVVRNVGAVQAGLMALPADERAAFVEQFNRRALSGLPLAGQSAAERESLTSLEDSFARSVSEQIALQGIDAEWRRDDSNSLSLGLTIDGTCHWFVLPNILPGNVFTGTLIAMLASSALLALMVALWLQYRFTRPLERMLEVSQKLAQGILPDELLPEDGPTEIVIINRRFNQLVNSLAQVERERALMLAGVSHDLRTPLTKLRLGVEILSKQAEPELMNSMIRSIKELDSIVGQFLDFARTDTTETAVPTVLDAIVEELAATYADHGKPLTLSLGGVPAVPLRPKAMRRAMINLIENAWRHGRPPVELHTGTSNGGVWFEVVDHGPGIAPAEAEELKQPFRRAQTARGGVAGAGLGLAIVDRIVRMHVGQFDLLPEEGGGLRARVNL